MDDDDFMEVNLTGLDLNQEPSNQPLHRVPRYGSLLNELETAHDQIEERIRQLEAVTARARQRQRWRQSRNSTEISGPTADLSPRSLVPNNNGGPSGSSTPGKGCKRDSSHLVAKALEMDVDVKKSDKEGGSFYDCSICLDLAQEPVLTCCGHLFCWPCFYQVSSVDSSDSKECPVCKGEVSDTTVIPIYGNGDGENVCVTESGLQIPPRPKARRVESVRQQRVTQGLSHVPVAEALRRIRISIGAMGSHTAQQQAGGGDHRIRIHQVSRVLSESAASLSSLSSALSNAERLVEDLESVINNRVLRGEASVDAGILAARPDGRMGDVGPPPASSSSSSGAVVRRRSIVFPRDPREPRRRRLN
ncbi:RING/U-box superfamily protein [Striga asiatica]|uniref:E3 ubiquitin-protein ligase RMA n=1 Tax=Striga asiatica TaxID=4170 RepID=A0A5A7QIM8_STRAF|nr:RING/U-box superfamily protein [Striga asiatica]